MHIHAATCTLAHNSFFSHVFPPCPFPLIAWGGSFEMPECGKPDNDFVMKGEEQVLCHAPIKYPPSLLIHREYWVGWIVPQFHYCVLGTTCHILFCTKVASQLSVQCQWVCFSIGGLCVEDQMAIYQKLHSLHWNWCTSTDVKELYNYGVLWTVGFPLRGQECSVIVI